MDLKEIQKKVWENKVNKGFNITDVNKEFCLLYGKGNMGHIIEEIKIDLNK